MADTATRESPQTKATLKYLRTSPYKVREVLDLIRGLDVDDARHVLQFSERGAAREVLKVLNSAVANADHTLNIPADELKVAVAFADEGPTIKRWRPRARGRATRIRKRTCHITIIVARLTDAELQARRRRDGTAATQRRRGVIPGRRRKAAEEAAPKAGKGKAAEAAAPDEEETTEAPEAAVEEAVVEEAPEAAVEEAPAAEEEAAPEGEAAPQEAVASGDTPEPPGEGK
jgi:large subunit ribosomal protein L22